MRVAAVAITGPIVEELCFRGITLGRMSGMRLWIALIIQATLFGIVHFNWLQSFYAFVLGVIFGVVYARFRSIWYPIVMHIAFNLCGVVMSATTDTAMEPPPILILFLAIVPAAVCAPLLFKRGAYIPYAIESEPPGGGQVQIPSGDDGDAGL
jgi:membrane protease YdiL (CAAX protease family)